MGLSMTMQSARFVVDRREGRMLVVENEEGVCHDVAAKELPADCRVEGAVLDVPIAGAVPQWSIAVRNRAEEQRRVADLTSRMNKLRAADAGGDVEL